MTGYDHAASYPSPQYNYVPNLTSGQGVGATVAASGVGDLSGDIRHHIHGWGQHSQHQYHHAHHHLGHAMGQQGPAVADQVKTIDNNGLVFEEKHLILLYRVLHVVLTTVTDRITTVTGTTFTSNILPLWITNSHGMIQVYSKGQIHHPYSCSSNNIRSIHPYQLPHTIASWVLPSRSRVVALLV